MKDLNMKILCTICVRGGSKGVKNKNIRLIKGKPLIAYTIEAAQKSGIFKHVVISTDSDEIAEVAQKFGGEVFFKRPEELSTDTAAKIPVIRHALCMAEERYKTKFDIHVDLDATSPLRTIDDIKNCIELLLENDYDNVITAMASRKSPYFNMVEIGPDKNVMLSKKLPDQIKRRQDAPQCYDMNASIYVWKRKILLSSDSVFNKKTGLYVMPENRSIDIDTESDFEYVSYLMEKAKNE